MTVIVGLSKTISADEPSKAFLLITVTDEGMIIVCRVLSVSKA